MGKCQKWNCWHGACNKGNVRIASKPAQSNLAMSQGTSAALPKQSFLDALASVSSDPVKWTASASADGAGKTDEHASGSTPGADQSTGSLSSLEQDAVKATESDSNGATASMQEQPAARPTEQVDDSAIRPKALGGGDDRNSPKISAKKAVFTPEVASPFVLQASTTQAQTAGTVSAVAPIENTTTTSKPDSAGQTGDSQAADAVSESGGQQSQAITHGAADGSDVQSPRMGQKSGEVLALAEVVRTVGAARQFGLQMAPDDGTVAGEGSEDGATSPSLGNEDKSGIGLSFAKAVSVLDGQLAATISTGTAIATNNQGVNPATAGTGQSEVAGAGPGVSAAGTSRPGKGDASGDGSTSSQSTGSANVQIQHSPSGSTQAAVVDAKSVDAATVQNLVAAVHTESRGSAETHNPSGASEVAAHHGDSAEVLEQEPANGMASTGMSGINSARLIQTMGATEMQVGMHSAEFGDISIRTTVSQQQMQTQISVEHSELGNVLSAHIAAIQAKLGSEYGLHSNIHLNQGGVSFSSEGNGSQQYRPRPAIQPVEALEAPATAQSDTIMPGVATVASNEYRLDIRA